MRDALQAAGIRVRTDERKLHVDLRGYNYHVNEWGDRTRVSGRPVWISTEEWNRVKDKQTVIREWFNVPM